MNKHPMAAYEYLENLLNNVCVWREREGGREIRGGLYTKHSGDTAERLCHRLHWEVPKPSNVVGNKIRSVISLSLKILGQ